MPRLAVALAAVVTHLSMAGAAAAATADQRAADTSLRAFLRTYLKPDPSDENRAAMATRAQAAWADLNGDDRPEAVVYVSGRGWCGSGGCHLLVLERRGSTYVVRGDLSVTRLPVSVLSRRTAGWSDLTVFVAGGGILPGYTAVVPFDGRRYASNPTVRPAYRLQGDVPETVLIGPDLYPFLDSR